jgi:hypothetical protein
MATVRKTRCQLYQQSTKLYHHHYDAVLFVCVALSAYHCSVCGDKFNNVKALEQHTFTRHGINHKKTIVVPCYSSDFANPLKRQFHLYHSTNARLMQQFVWSTFILVSYLFMLSTSSVIGASQLITL